MNNNYWFKKFIITFLIASFIISIFIISSQVRSHTDIQLLPVEEAFSTWKYERFGFSYDHVYMTRVVPTETCRPFVSVYFQSTENERLRIEDEEVHKYLATLPVKEIMFDRVDISVSSVFTLLGNPNIKSLAFNYSSESGVRFELSITGAREYYKDVLLKYAEDPKEDFATFLDPKNDSGKEFKKAVLDFFRINS